MYALFNFDHTSTLYALIRDCKLIYFSEFLKIFVKYSVLIWKIFEKNQEKLGNFSRVSLIMNKIASFYPVRLFNFCQNSTLYAYSGL